MLIIKECQRYRVKTGCDSSGNTCSKITHNKTTSPATFQISLSVNMGQGIFIIGGVDDGKMNFIKVKIDPLTGSLISTQERKQLNGDHLLSSSGM